MRRTLFYLITLTLFAIVRVNGHAQEISDFDFNYFSSDETLVKHTFHITGVPSSGGTYCPNINTTQFGIIHHENGIAPYNVNKEMLLNALQDNVCSVTGNYVNIPESFQYYDFGSSTFKKLKFLNYRKTDGSMALQEDFFGKAYIFCWITSGKLWYCRATITSYRIAYEESYLIHYSVEFTFDANIDIYGIWYYDL